MSNYLLLPCVLIMTLQQCISDVHELTREEAEHTGQLFTPAAIVKSFQRSSFSRNYDLQNNDFVAHHNIATAFCKSRASGCTWKDYYNVLDHTRTPYANLFDPGQDPIGIPLSKLQEKARSGHRYQSTCDIIDKPSASKFYQYVEGSKPVIIRGLIPHLDSHTWSLANLTQYVGDVKVVASAAPTSEFDAPEDASLWGFNEERDKPIDLIVRPAHIPLLFSEFIELLQRSDMNNSNFYLEYFPMHSAFHGCTTGGRDCDDLLDQFPEYSFANFLSMRYHLLWMGGAGVKGGTAAGPDSTGQGPPNSRMHFDRLENLMTVITGSKTFHLYDPSQSDNLHGGRDVIAAAFSATVTRHAAERNDRQVGRDQGRTKGSDGGEVYCADGGDKCPSETSTSPSDRDVIDIMFSRDPMSVSMEPNAYHTYSPVNIRNPNITRHPQFRRAKGMQCTVNPGDTLFVPSHWWHEVISMPDEEGKSIGSNVFFEPFYTRPGYNTLAEVFQRNRYYAHIQTIKSAKPCSKKKVCWTDSSPSSFETSTMETRVVSGDNRKPEKDNAYDISVENKVSEEFGFGDSQQSFGDDRHTTGHRVKKAKAKVKVKSKAKLAGKVTVAKTKLKAKPKPKPKPKPRAKKGIV